MEGRKRELHVGFDTSGAKDPTSLAPARGVIEKGRLAQSGLPPQNQCTALSAPYRAQQLVERRALDGATTKHRPRDEAHQSGPRCAIDVSVDLAADLDVAHCRSNKPPRWQLKPGVGESRPSPDPGAPWLS